MTSDAGAVVEIGTVDPGLVGTTKVVADNKSYTAGGAVRGRFPSVLHPRLECTEAEHKFRYVFRLVRYYRFGGPRRGEIVHSYMLEMMLYMVEMMPVWWFILSLVWRLILVVISSN